MLSVFDALLANPRVRLHLVLDGIKRNQNQKDARAVQSFAREVLLYNAIRKGHFADAYAEYRNASPWTPIVRDARARARASLPRNADTCHTRLARAHDRHRRRS